MLDAQTIAALVDLIDREGEAIVFIDTQLADDTEDFDVADGVDVPTPGKGYVGPVDTTRFEGTNVVSSDIGLFLYAPDAPAGFRDDWTIEIGGNAHSIVAKRGYKSGGVVILLELAVRA